MIIDRAAEDLLAEVFAEHAEDRPDANLVLAEFRRSLGERRHIPRAALTVLAAVATVAAIATAAVVLSDRRSSTGPAAGPSATTTSTHPGLDQLSPTCLDMATVLASWGNPTSGYGGIASDKPDGSRCSHEVQIIWWTHPRATSSVVAGGRTIHIAASPGGIRTGYIALNRAESAAAAKAGGQNWDPTRPYYLIVSIPADNPQSVLVSILEQDVLPGH